MRKLCNSLVTLRILIAAIFGIFYYRWKYTARTTYECVESKLDSVEKRLLESNENWLRSLEYRKHLERQHPLDERDQWSYRGGINFWDFFYPSFDCPHTSQRVGRSGDGGKWICGFPYIARRSRTHPCIVYSYGVYNEYSFDREILERSNCSVYMYDPSVNPNFIPLPRQFPKRAFLEVIGLGTSDNETIKTVTNGSVASGVKLVSYSSRSLKTQMKKNGHTFIDILKMDIEGEEFEILPSFNVEFPDGPPFGQLVVEIHIPSDPTPNLYSKILKPWMKSLEEMGLRPYKYEINPGAVHSSKRHTPHCWEYSFINVKYDNYLLHEEGSDSSDTTRAPKKCNKII